jgi:nucleoid DNA-binding protein
MAKASNAAKSITKSELYAQVAEASATSKAEVKKFFEALTAVIQQNLGKKGPGVLTLPGLFKLRAVKKPATKGGKQVLNRFTGQMTTTKDKPASTAVRARALKQLTSTIK